MDEQARKSARTRAAIAFGLAGVLLVVNIGAMIAWREDRRERFNDARIEFHQRMNGDQDDLNGPGGRQFPGDRPNDGNGNGQGNGQYDQGGRPPMGPGGRMDGGQGAGDQGSTDQPSGNDQDSSDQDQEGAA